MKVDTECHRPRSSFSLFIYTAQLELNLEVRFEVLCTLTVFNMSRQVWYKFTDAYALKMDTNFVPKSRLILHIIRHYFFIIK